MHMEAAKVINVQGKPDLWLPPGFRFHPTDDELISFYLTGKVLNSRFAAHAIAEVDLNKFEPWDLPERANIGEKEWYFFTLRDRKYPTGMRTNRATMAGYWKATGKDRDVISSRASCLVGMKKTLVFYRGRAPRGEKTNWIMHEYRLEGNSGALNSLKATKEWVVCRIFQKKTGLKKHLALQTDKDMSYSGSEPPSPVAARCHIPATQINTDANSEINWYNDQAACVIKHQSHENSHEMKEYLSENDWTTKGRINFFAPPDHTSTEIGQTVPNPPYVTDAHVNSSLSLTPIIHQFAQELVSSQYSSTAAASKDAIAEYSCLVKSCKLEPYFYSNLTADQPLTTSAMAGLIINSWMGLENLDNNNNNLGIRHLPPLQHPPPAESAIETTNPTVTPTSHRPLRSHHSDPSCSMIELDHLYCL